MAGHSLLGGADVKSQPDANSFVGLLTSQVQYQL
jgi:hypothetical protein